MKTLHNTFLAGLLTCLLPWNALADGGPECVVDEDSGMLVPANGSGACFGDFGFSVVVVDLPGGGFVLAGNPPDDNQWFRNNPNGRGQFHAATEVVFLAYCSPATVQADACFPGSDETFLGQGEVVLNTAQQGLVFTCPLTARVSGIAADGFGNLVEVEAALTTVPDVSLGCRATIQNVEATPVVED